MGASMEREVENEKIPREVMLLVEAKVVDNEGGIPITSLG